MCGWSGWPPKPCSTAAPPIAFVSGRCSTPSSSVSSTRIPTRCAGTGHSVVAGLVPGAHPVVALRDDVVELGHVAGRPDIRDIRLEELVRYHADVRLESGALEDVDVHGETEAYADHVGLRREPFRADDLELSVGPLELLDRLVVVEMHAGVLGQQCDDFAALLIERPPQEP